MWTWCSRRSSAVKAAFLRVKLGPETAFAPGPRSVALQDVQGEISMLARSGAGAADKLCAMLG